MILKNCMLHDKSDKRERKLNEHNQEREKEITGKVVEKQNQPFSLTN